MRLLLLILMIALTPLRGWAGDAGSLAMATEQLMMAPQTLAANGKASAAHPDCMGHSGDQAAVAAVSGAVEDDHGAGHCPTCSACQICSLAAMAVQVRISPFLATPHGLPAVGSTSFASAAPALGFKPPIS